MKKLIWVLFLIGVISVLQAQNYQGAIATTDYVTGLTILQADNATPVPDGWLVQIMLPGVDGLIDPPNPDGTPGGDDFLVTGVGNNYYEFPFDTSWTGIPGQLYTPSVWVWPAAGQGAEPVANVGENIYLRIFDATTVPGAAQYLNSALFLLPGVDGNLYFNTTAHWDYGTEFNWQNISAGQTIPPSGGTVGGGTTWGDNTVTFLGGNSGTIDLIFDPTTPPPGLAGEIPTPQDISWLFDTSGATIIFWPVTVYLEWPFDPSITFGSSALVHYTDDGVNPAGWYALVAGHPTLPVHPDNIGEDHNFSWDFSGDPQWVQFDTWVLSDWGMDGDQPLPVTLTDFAAEFVADNLTILWTTQSENSNMGWNIYRGESNTALEEDNTILINGVELIDGAGTTSEPTNYEFIDEHPVVENNTYWYWLESVSYSNDTGIYGPISLTIPEEETPPPLPTITLLRGNYPNPLNLTNRKFTYIQFDIKKGETAKLTIYNIRGQIVESKTFEPGTHKYNWYPNDNASGVYLYKLSSESYTKIKKMMILK